MLQGQMSAFKLVLHAAAGLKEIAMLNARGIRLLSSNAVVAPEEFVGSVLKANISDPDWVGVCARNLHNAYPRLAS